MLLYATAFNRPSSAARAAVALGDPGRGAEFLLNCVAGDMQNFEGILDVFNRAIERYHLLVDR